MSETIRHFTVIREYDNRYGLEVLMARIIRQQIKKAKAEQLSKRCSNHEVVDYEKQHGK